MLLETQKITQEAVEKAETLFLYCDPAGKIILCNKRMEEMVAINRESIIGNDLLKVLYHRICSRQNNEKLFKAMFDDAVKYKRSSVFEAVLIDGSTDEHVICWQTSPILTANKELEGVLFLGNDVTELKERETSIKTIDETLKNIFLSIKEYGLYTTNLEGNITYYGMGSEEMFGWKRDEIIFKHISVLHNYDDISYKLSFILEQVRNFGRYELESYFIKKDGQTFPVNLTVTKFIDSNRDMSGYIFMARDITEKRKLEYQIFQSEKLAAVGQLIAGLAHEINNPVFVISGRTDMMLADKLIGRRVKSELKIINNQIDQIRKLVDRFLAFTRKASPNQIELDINKV
ncbi:MAG: PAS domain S-box protein, partial [Candidatus Omnitrophica bacterium]|nr:PAS domain S-box protein [Candidatus Omnitrophota bacterium]